MWHQLLQEFSSFKRCVVFFAAADNNPTSVLRTLAPPPYTRVSCSMQLGKVFLQLLQQPTDPTLKNQSSFEPAKSVGSIQRYTNQPYHAIRYGVEYVSRNQGTISSRCYTCRCVSFTSIPVWPPIGIQTTQCPC